MHTERAPIVADLHARGRRKAGSQPETGILRLAALKEVARYDRAIRRDGDGFELLRHELEPIPIGAVKGEVIGIARMIEREGDIVDHCKPIRERIDFLEFTEALCMLGVRRGTARTNRDGNRAMLEENFAQIEQAWSRRHASDFVDALYRYHIALNHISGNGFVEFFYRRPYIRFYTIMLADLAPGGLWDEYIANYRQIHQTILAGEPAAAVERFSRHISWVLSFMEDDNSAREG